MTSISTSRQRELLRRMAELCRERASLERDIEHTYSAGLAFTKEQFDGREKALADAHQDDVDQLQAKLNARLETARHTFEATAEQSQVEHDHLIAEAESRHHEGIEAGEQERRVAVSSAENNYLNDIALANEVGTQAHATVENCRQQMDWLLEEVAVLFRRRGRALQLQAPDPASTQLSTAQLLTRYGQLAQEINESLAKLRQQFAVRFVDDGWPILLSIAAAALGGGVAGFAMQTTAPIALLVAGVSSLVIGVGSHYVMQSVARRGSAGALDQLTNQLNECSRTVAHAEEMVKLEKSERERQLTFRRDQQLDQAEAAWKKTEGALHAELETVKRNAEGARRLQEQQAQKFWDDSASETRTKFLPMIKERNETFERQSQQLKEDRESEVQRLGAEYNERWDALIQKWQTEFRAIVDECDAMQRFCESSFDALDSIDWTQWTPPLSVPPAMPFGAYTADFEQLDGGLSGKPELAVDRSEQTLPALLSFPSSPSLLLEAELEGRDRAVDVMQQVMLRFLTSFPAGKVRFTIIDPVGLGQNFSAFMHLADYDERLVTNRIWTEAGHINQRLADLTEHMENVIQKYLRNEFNSIQEYNEHAGEVAEPFQVLVISNFPTGFGEEATRRLVSIASSGARCGVFTLIGVDMKMKLPRNFDLADLETQANTLLWADSRFQWKYEDLRQWPMAVTRPPSNDTMTALIKAAGEHAVDANRVEVPFEVVAPTEDAWWSDDSRKAIEVPLGRAGATKLQYMHLGKGTSQHVLVAGKTGSGKSTLMHAIVTNLAIHYSPDELEFYLIDFKKGVEFKTYAQYQLPHARVIAIESEREFGLSVLERLDAELQSRGDRFRASGVQSVAAYRDANPDERMPRILLLVDEFQEFFVKDDKISNDASLLLDRLVRQGRAFGIHILLGTQTLAGAYSLARSTIGQMAVRIALQCSEGDAHLILSEDNTAARLLNRPGEAIYNNANGLFEGNHPFQVVWLPDAQREDYLRRLQVFARERNVTTPPPIVFEGNIPANAKDNVLLARALSTEPTATPAPPPKAWLGSPVAITNPTEIVFRRQSGSHLLIVGMQEELAAGMMTSAAIGLAATTKRSEGAMRFVVLDGGTVDSHEMNLGARLERSLDGRVTKPLLQELAGDLAALDAEVTRRVDENVADADPICLLVYNLSRFRDLRKADDDFGLSGFGEEEKKTPAKMFANILREGPAVGVHAIVWCDTFNNVSRWLDRQLLRDIAWRALFQMSATDSSNLMDSAAASQLGANRAILYDDERGEFEKFRPYGLPDNEWLASIAGQLG